ncbi:MAG: hypothetical protein NC543_11830 [bacterium]|nr:hypothetical protein [bacterium]MCM1376050.1 hypothetical protein [Muribaculum sp.]
MDTFIDKLAQRLTAQEMIKANTAADAEELHKLQGQVKQYEACLDEMRNVNSATMEAVNRLQQTGEVSAEMIDRLEHASVASASVIERLETAIESALQAINRMEHMQEVSMGLVDRLEHASVASAAASESIDQLVNAGIDKLQHAEVNVDGINELVQTSIGKINAMQQNTDNFQTLLRDSAVSQNEAINDFVHKESVKVYRNVQAVVVEEAAKQTEGREKVSKSGSNKMLVLMGLSGAALLASIGSLVFQILTLYHII